MSTNYEHLSTGELLKRLDAAFERARAGRTKYLASNASVEAALVEARSRCSSDEDFARWLNKHGIKLDADISLP